MNKWIDKDDVFCFAGMFMLWYGIDEKDPAWALTVCGACILVLSLMANWRKPQ